MILAAVPQLQHLQIVNCLNITHMQLLRMIEKTAPSSGSLLTSLALTVYLATPSADALWPQLLCLKHLTIYIRQCNRDLFGDTIRSILSCVNQAALESLTLRHVEEVKMPQMLLDAIIRAHNGTLKRMNVVNFSMTSTQVEKLCRELRELTQLAFYMTMGIVRSIPFKLFII